MTGLLLAGCGGTLRSRSAVVCNPTEAEFNSVEVQQVVSRSVVRIVTRAGRHVGSGTGFILADEAGSEQKLVATANHVVQLATEVVLQVPVSGEHMEIGATIVKVDPDHDLALLAVPRGAINAEGLVLSSHPVTAGQRIATVGYPYIAGGDARDAKSVYSEGQVSAASQRIYDTDYIQTDMNLNPGNSGGPVFDGCAAVVGVVSATHKEASRAGLVAPVRDLTRLMERLRQGKPPAGEAIPKRIAAFFAAVAFRDGSRAVRFVSRSFVVQQVARDWDSVAKDAVAKHNACFERRSGSPKYAGLSTEELAGLCVRETALTRLEKLAFEVWGAVEEGALDEESALRVFLSAYVSDVFGNLKEHRVEEVIVVDDDRAKALVRVVGDDEGIDLYEIVCEYERGEWMLSAIQHVRHLEASRGKLRTNDQTAVARPATTRMSPVSDPVTGRLPPATPSTRSAAGSRVMRVGFGVAGVGVLSGSTTGMMAISAANSAREHCSGTVCSAAASGDLERGRILATVANVSFCGAAAGAALGLVALLGEPSSERQTEPDVLPRQQLRAVRPWILPTISPRSIGFVGRF